MPCSGYDYRIFRIFRTIEASVLYVIFHFHLCFWKNPSIPIRQWAIRHIRKSQREILFFLHAVRAVSPAAPETDSGTFGKRILRQLRIKYHTFFGIIQYAALQVTGNASSCRSMGRFASCSRLLIGGSEVSEISPPKNAICPHADSDVQPPTLYKPGSFLITIHWTAPRSYNSLSEIHSANTFPAVHRSHFPE